MGWGVEGMRAYLQGAISTREILQEQDELKTAAEHEKDGDMLALDPGLFTKPPPRGGARHKS